MPARAPLTRVPWQDWPLWKQVFLVLVIAGVAYALLRAAVQLWRAGERILAAFATLLGVLVQTLPSFMIAGVVALAGLWVLNNVDPLHVAGAILPADDLAPALGRLLGGAPFAVRPPRQRGRGANQQLG
jgi:hypothetical protein